MSLSNFNPGQELASTDFSAVIGGPLSAIVKAQAQSALSTVDFVKSVGFTPDTEDDATGEITPGEPIYVSFKYPKMVQPYQPGVTGQLQSVTLNNGGANYAVGDNLSVDGILVSVTAINGSGAITTFSFDAQGATGFSDQTNVAATGGSGTNATFNIDAEDIDPVPAVFEEMRLQVPIITMLPIPFIRVEEGELDFNAKITSMEYANVASTFKYGTSLSVTNRNTNKNYAFVGSFNFNKNVNTVSLKTSISYQRTQNQGQKVEKTYHLGVKVKVGQDELPEGMERLLGILEDAIVAQPVES